VLGVAQLDATGTDQGDYLAGPPASVVFRVGTGATGTAGGKLGPGQGTTVSFSVTVNPNTFNKTITNTVTVNSTASSTLTAYTNTQTAVITVRPMNPPDLSTTLVKAVLDENGGTLDPGNTLTYTISFSNSGENTATLVTVNDLIPASTTYVAGSMKVLGVAQLDATGTDQGDYIAGPPARVVFRVGTGASGTLGGTMAAGQATTVSFRVTVNPNTFSKTITNTVTVNNTASGTLTPYTSTQTAVITVRPLTFATTLTKTVVDENGGTLDPGNTLTYTIVYSNTGEDTATLVVINDPIPASTTFVAGSLKVVAAIMTDGAADDLAEYDSVSQSVRFRVGTGASATAGGTLAAGQTTTVTFRVTVDASTYSKTITNTVSVNATASSTLTPYTSTQTAVITVRPLTPSNLTTSLTKTVLDVNGGTVDPGDILEYTIAFTNTGEDAAILVAVTDPIPASTTFVLGSLKVLGVGMSDGAADDLAEYDSALKRVVFRVGTGATGLTGGTLLAGQGTTVTFSVTIDPSTGGKTITNTVTVSSTASTSLTPFTDTKAAVITVRSLTPPNLATSLTKTVVDTNGGTLDPGNTLTYTIAFSNTGEETATLVLVNDLIPASTTYVAGSMKVLGVTQLDAAGGDQGDYIAGPPARVVFRVGTGATGTAGGTLAAGQGTTVSFSVTVNPNTFNKIITNTVTVSSTASLTLTPITATQTALITVRGINPPNLAATLVKTVLDVNGGQLNAGDILEYNIAFSNTGEDTATMVVVNDLIPTSTTYVANSLKVVLATPAITTATPNDNPNGDQAEYIAGPPARVVFRVGTGIANPVGGSLGPGQSTTVTFRVTVDASTAGKYITNTVSVSSTAQTSLTPYTNTATAVIRVFLAEPDLATSMTKTVVDENGGTLDPGNTLTYTIAFSNTGVDTATNVIMSDVIPGSTTYVAGSLVVLAGANAGPKSDTSGAGDDQAEYDPVLNRVVFRVGIGATNLAGGTLAPGQGTTLTFRVTVNPGTAGKTIPNTANVAYNGQLTPGTNYLASKAVSFTVTALAAPVLTHQKIVQVISDPINGTTDPKNIPGAVSQYTITINNTGNGPVDAGTLAISDPIPNNSELFTGNLSGGAPYIFTDAPLSSGLTCPFVALNSTTDCVDFSKDGGSTWLYTPVTPYDPLVTHIRFKMTGAMNADGIPGAPYPSFTLQFQTRLK
jgi:uncharacterized repeat protein (TIGR01451 family)